MKTRILQHLGQSALNMIHLRPSQHEHVICQQQRKARSFRVVKYIVNDDASTWLKAPETFSP